MVILYEGEFCRFPKKEDIIATALGENWVELVKENGIEPERYSRYAFDGHHTYVDFGSWSKFIVKVDAVVGIDLSKSSDLQKS